jgi:hypothetical protein
MTRRRFAHAGWACAWLSAAACADPWLPPGDEALRHDIQLLADSGLLRGPVTTWPISWPDIARDVAGETPSGKRDEAVEAALLRVQRRARGAAFPGFTGGGLRVAGAHEPTPLRGFADWPREEGEVGLRAGWLGSHVAWNLQATAVADADDRRTVRADGSYIGVNIGNFMVSAGLMERWWGPGWEGSLILSTNARPIPTFTVERNYTDPFRLPVLRWLGPWRASIALGQAEGHDVAVPDVRFLAARVNFKPRPWLELGLTRTAQWCGEGRDCGWDTFKDLLIGRDNRGDGLSEDDEPGNQLAGYDLRLRSPWRRLPLALYTQWIGEDEAGGLPSKFMGQFGAETWFSVGANSVRVHAEYADTTCTFTREPPDFDCAYRNTLYPQGYAYRGRIVGHSIDNDSRLASLGVILVRPDGASSSATFRDARLNRDGSGVHAISVVPAELRNVELRHSQQIAGGMATLGLGYDQAGDGAGIRSGARGFVTWQRGF